MIEIRRYKTDDEERLGEFLKNVGIKTGSEPLEYFWIALEGDELIGSVRVEIHRGFAFLSHLYVVVQKRKQGLAKRLIEESLKKVHCPTYLYTVIPEFFEEIGFKSSVFHPNLPPREMFGCEGCDQDRCMCMVRSIDDSKIS
jgi:N-acetylglutamate synthase-like GNAT family acetyltransferase